MSDDLRYPVGKFSPEDYPDRTENLETVANLPARLREAVTGLDEGQLDTEYRPGGWTVRQTVHHVADSHANSIIRFKLALTEDVPTIRPYYEDRWAKLADAAMPVEVSLRLTEAVHDRWTTILRSMTEADYQRKLIHPESGAWTLEAFLAMYAWHSKHHTAHITALRERSGW